MVILFVVMPRDADERGEARRSRRRWLAFVGCAGACTGPAAKAQPS
jgi:hypothetical protein